MNRIYDSGLRKPVSARCALIVMLTALLVLAGWVWDVAALRSVLPGYVSMKVNTAVCFLSLGLALLLAATGHRPLVLLARVPAFLTVGLAGLVLAQHLTGADLGIDQWVLADRTTEGQFQPGRMAFNTAICLLLTGTGAWLVTGRNPSVKAAQALFALSILIAYAALLSYGYGVRGFTGLNNYTQMGLHTALCVLTLATGFLLLAPRAGYLALLSREYEGGKKLRTLVLAVLLMPLLVGSLSMWGYRQGYYTIASGIALFALVYSVLLLGVLVVVFGRLRTGELARRGQEAQLQQLNRELSRNLEELAASEKELQVANEELLASNEQLQAATAEVERLSAEALAASKQQYRELADSITDPVIMMDSALRYLYMNKAAEQLAGKPASELIGKTLLEVFGEALWKQAAKRMEAVQRVIRTGQAETLVDQMMHGTARKTMEYSIYPTQAGHALVITRDITDRVEAEQQYRDLAESLTLPLVVYDKDLRYRYLNRAVEGINGVPAGELLGKTGREVFGEAFAPREQVCRQVMETRQPVVYLETPVRDGKKHYWEIAVYPTGRGGTLVLNHDITELVEARHHLQEQQEALKDSYTALQASEAQVRKVLDSMFIFAGLVSLDGKLLYANSAPLKAMGVALEAVMDQPFDGAPWFYAEAERQKFREGLTKAARGETVRYDTRTLDQDGNVLLLDLTLGPLRNEQGQVTQIIASGVDVTARREAEGKLQQSNDRYQALVDNFPNGGVFLVDRELRYQVVGGAGLTAVGLTGPMLLGKTPQEVFPEAVATPATAAFRRTLGGASLAFEDRYAGGVHQVRTSPICDEQGQVVAAMVVTQNITREKEAEEGLRFYQFLVDHTEDPIYWISPEDNFRFSYVNRATCAHFGMSEEQLLSMSIPDWDPAFSWEKCAEFNDLIREKKRLVFETQHRHGNGEIIPAEISATLLFYKGKEYYAGYIKDLRERKKAEAALRESEERYRHLFESNKDPLFLVDTQTGKIMDVNPAACLTYGYTREEFTRMNNVDISAEPERTLQSMREQEAVVPLRYHKKKDSGVFPVELVFNYLVINGRPASIVAVRDITERVEAARRLEAEKQRLELAIWGADLGMWDWHIPSGKVVRNGQYDKMLGYGAGELESTADSWVKSVHPDDFALTAPTLQAYVAGRTDHYHSEHRLKTKSGGWLWTLARGKVVERDPAGNPVRMIGIQQDISEAKRKEESLRFFEYLTDNSPDPIFWIDPQNDFRFAYANQAAIRHYGIPRERLLSMSIPDWDPTFTPEHCREHLHYMREAGSTHFETLHQLPNGKKVPVEISSFLLRYQDREYLAGHFKDITTRKQAEGEIRKLAMVAQQTENAVIITDASGVIEWVNEGFTRISGYAFEEAVGHKPGFLLQGAETDPAAVQKMRNALEKQEGVALEVLNYTKTGTPYWLHIAIQPVFDEAGVLRQFIAIESDITERKRAEATILELNTSLEQKVEERTAQLLAVNKELEAFSYSVSHDLRSPLRSIDGFSRMLLSDYEDKLDADGKDYLHTIRQATARMGHLIDDLLKLSKVSRAELRRFGVDLSAMAGQILGELARETPGRQVTCHVAAGLQANADHRLLHIALHNLLSNAWKYSARKAEATIEVGKTDTPQGEAFYVKDNGAGFDLAHAGKLFGAFQRLHSVQEFEGTGIGLAIVQRIILKHGGEIWAEAARDRGATFFFTLPAS
jgi:PAS domain S-box-containing protein